MGKSCGKQKKSELASVFVVCVKEQGWACPQGAFVSYTHQAALSPWQDYHAVHPWIFQLNFPLKASGDCTGPFGGAYTGSSGAFRDSQLKAEVGPRVTCLLCAVFPQNSRVCITHQIPQLKG